MSSRSAEALTAPPEARRDYEQERLVRSATERISEAMEEAGISRADLARMMGTSRANVTTLLSGERNMTLRTLADLAAVLGQRVEITLEPLRLPAAISRRLHASQEEIAEFCRKHHIRRLALFGSVLRDDFGPESDVDVLVEFASGQRLGFAFFGIQEELSELLGRRVDLLTEEDLSRYFRDEVVQNAEVIFDAEAQPHAA